MMPTKLRATTLITILFFINTILLIIIIQNMQSTDKSDAFLAQQIFTLDASVATFYSDYKNQNFLLSEVNKNLPPLCQLCSRETSDKNIPLWEQKMNFNQISFSNITGNPSGCYLVPNYIHFIRFGEETINYVQMICILAAFKNQKPDKLFFHYNNNKTFSGKYWDVLRNTPGFMDIVQFEYTEIPTEIFGQVISEGWNVWHGGDITKINVLMKYGGIFLDNDCYLIQSLNKYRVFEMTLNWDKNQYLGAQTLLAHKDARFLREWLDCYRVYNANLWYYNAGERPTIEVLYNRPELIHRVKVLFGADIKFISHTFNTLWEDWRNMYVMHLLIRHMYLLKNVSSMATFPVEFDEVNIVNYPVTFREMAYDVYDTAKVSWTKIYNN